MIGFMFLSLILLIIVIWLIAPALLGKRELNKDDSDLQNTEIAKERLAELESRLEQGDISQQEFEQTQVEIEKSLLQDVHDGESKAYVSPKIERNAYVLITAIPIMALALYWLWGSPDSIHLSAQSSNKSAATQSSQTAGNKQQVGSVEEMARQLEKKLHANPNNPNGWYTLGRTYMSLKDFDKAVAALKRLRKLVGDEPAVLITLADALTMANQGRMSGEPFELVKLVLQKKPDDPTALWLAGLGYEEANDRKTAIKHWKKLLPLIKDEPRSVQQIKLLIAAAERKIGIEPTVTPTPLTPNQSASSNSSSTTNASAVTASIKVTVKLAEGLKTKVSPTDFVLVYARAVSGPRMPLAIVRKQVRDLPMTLVLDDSMAMQPSMKLSNFAKVNLIARISKLGQAIPKSGDAQGEFGPVEVKETRMVTVIIDRILP